VGRIVIVVAAALVAGPAAAQEPTPAPLPAPTPVPVPQQTGADFYQQGQEMVERGDFVTAIAAFTRAFELEPENWEYKLALADAERQASQCDRAIPRYKELLDAPAADKARVKAAVAQCPNAVVIESQPPPPELKLPPPPPEPKIIEREGPPSMLNGALLAGAGALFGASIGFYFAGRGSESDADDARSFADHERIQTRADRQKIAAGVLMVGALGLGGYAIYRIKFPSERAEVAVTPTATGGAMVVRGSW
jgi:tetratricopeptide (TPR) repeat protein